MSYQLIGRIKVLGETEQKSEKFRVRTFVVTVEDTQYPQDILFQATNDKCDLLNTFAIGANVTVHFNLRGREWTSPQGEVKYFNSLDAWKIEDASVSANVPPQVPANQQPVSVNPETQGDDDLPF